MKWQMVSVLMVAGMLCGAARAFGGELALGSVPAHRGDIASVPVTYRPGSGTAVALATDIRFNAVVLMHPRCEPGSALTGTATGTKSVKCDSRRSGLVHLAVVGVGHDTSPLPAGEVARVIFDVGQNAGRHQYELEQRATASNADGRNIRLKTRSGAVRVD